MTLEIGSNSGPNQESLALLQRLASGCLADASMKFRVFGERGNLQADKAVPAEAVFLNNMWMLLPGGPDRDIGYRCGFAGLAGQGTIAQYRLAGWDQRSDPKQMGYSAYLLGLKPAQLFEIVDTKLRTLGVDLAALKEELTGHVQRMVMSQPLELYPHDRYQSLLLRLYPLLRAEGLSHRDLTKQFNCRL